MPNKTSNKIPNYRHKDEKTKKIERRSRAFERGERFKNLKPEDALRILDQEGYASSRQQKRYEEQLKEEKNA